MNQKKKGSKTALWNEADYRYLDMRPPFFPDDTADVLRINVVIFPNRNKLFTCGSPFSNLDNGVRGQFCTVSTFSAAVTTF